MWQIVIGIFLILHGLVHALYFGHSMRLFQLQPGMAWPDASWVFSRFLGDEAVRVLAAVSCVVAAIGFVVGGAALLATQGWFRPVVVGFAAFSGLAFVLLWDGQPQALANKGLFAVLINLAILFAMVVFQWPGFDF